MLAESKKYHQKHKVNYPFEVALTKMRNYKYINHIQADSRRQTASPQLLAKLLKKLKVMRKFMVPIKESKNFLFSSLKPLSAFLTYVKIAEVKSLISRKMAISCKNLEESYYVLSSRKSIVFEASRKMTKLGIDGLLSPDLLKYLTLKLNSLKHLESCHLFAQFNQFLPSILRDTAPILSKNNVKRVSLYSFQGTNNQTPSLTFADGSAIDEMIVTLFNSKCVSEILKHPFKFNRLKKLDFVFPNFLEAIPITFSYDILQNPSKFQSLKENTFSGENTEMNIDKFISNLRFPQKLETLNLAIPMKDYFKIFNDPKSQEKNIILSMESFQRELANLSELKNLKLEFVTDVPFERSYISFFHSFLRKLNKLESLDINLKTPFKFIPCCFDLESLIGFCLPKLQKIESLIITAKEIRTPVELKTQLPNLKKLILNMDPSAQKPIEKANANELLNQCPNIEVFRSSMPENLGKRELRKRIKLVKEMTELEEVTMNIFAKKGDDDNVVSLIKSLMENKRVKKIMMQFIGFVLSKETQEEIEKLMNSDMNKKVMIGFHNAMINKEPFTRKYTVDLRY